MPDSSLVAKYAVCIAEESSPGFVVSELVRAPYHKFGLPPRNEWNNIRDTLDIANMLRERMIMHGCRGLIIAAAYRPHGGARNSTHKKNRALDLDLMFRDWKDNDDIRRIYYRESVALWCSVGRDYKMGLGLYCGKGRQAGIRVHIDTGYRCRTWQNHPSIEPPAARLIAAELGLRVPTEMDDHT